MMNDDRTRSAIRARRMPPLCPIGEGGDPDESQGQVVAIVYGVRPGSDRTFVP